MRSPTQFLLAVASCVALSGCVTTPAPSAAPAPAAVAPVPAPVSARTNAVVRGNIIIAGQPTADDLAAWRKEGVRGIFNVRTPTEMADRNVVPFDEAAAAGELGLTYEVQPIGGAAHPFSPAVLEAFAARVQAGSEPLLLHCGTGNRAGQLYAAYAVKYLGKTPDEAMRDLEPLGLWPLPIERMTGIEMKLVPR